MPIVQLPHLDADKTITRVVGYDVIRHVLGATGISERFTSIFYPDSEGTTYQPGSSIGASSLENDLKPDSFNQVSVEVSEESDMQFLHSTNVFTPENLFTFHDSALGISIRPSYAVKNLDIAFSYRARDKNGAHRWRDEIQQKISAGRMTYLHDVSYSYFIPQQYWVILQALYALRERQAGYGQSWEQYLAAYLSANVTEMVGQDGKNAIKAVRETQGRLLGWFDFEGAPEKGSRDGIGDTWTIAFNYHLQYNKPVESILQYPIVVHNQLLDQKWRPGPDNLDLPENHMQRYPLSVKAGLAFESDTPMIQMVRSQGLRIPNFDEWVTQYPIPDSLPMVTAAVLIDPSQPQFLLSLAQPLDTYVIDPEILAWMVDEAPYMTTWGQSIFHLALFQSGTPFLNGQLSVDANLNVSLVNPPNFRIPYHVQLSVNRDLGGLNYAAKNRARLHCRALLRILKILSDRFAGLDESFCLPGDQLSLTDMNDLGQMSNKLLNAGQVQSNNEEYGFYMIEKLGIITAHRSMVTPATTVIGSGLNTSLSTP